MAARSRTEEEMNADAISEIIKKEGIKLISLHFTDINGILKSFAISSSDVRDSIENGTPFDGSSITGFHPIEESDMVAKPDPTTFRVIPWETNKRVARMICDIYLPNGKRFEGDPRYIAERAVKSAERLGYSFKCGPELEFFLLKRESEKVLPTDSGGYFDFHPLDLGEDIRTEIVYNLERLGLHAEVSHHEVAPGQHEIDFRYDDLLKTADRAVTLKVVVKAVAHLRGCVGTFMPKPKFGINGSGMHVHQSLWDIKTDENAFYDPDSEREDKLSDVALHFIGGQLKYINEAIAILASWPNSYKRLVPGYEAPVYAAWAHANRSTLLRVPYTGGREGARVEIRCPDPAGNPYLQFATLCSIGLEGVKNRVEAPEPIERNLYRLNYRERKGLGIASVPGSLGEALEMFEESKLMRKILGSFALENFISVKREEWDHYRMQVSKWEVDRYLEWV